MTTFLDELWESRGAMAMEVLQHAICEAHPGCQHRAEYCDGHAQEAEDMLVHSPRLRRALLAGLRAKDAA